MVLYFYMIFGFFFNYFILSKTTVALYIKAEFTHFFFNVY